MTKSNRIGHWRTNKHGTTTWVTEHTVEKTVYTVSKNGSEKYVNGQKLLNTYCNYCYKKVFFISLNENKRLFNNDSEPLIVHKCRNRNANIEVNEKPTKTKKFLDEDDLKALNRRVEALRQKSNLRKEERRIKREKKKAAKERKKELNRENLNKANEKVVNKAFFISGGKKQSQRLKQIAIGHVNKHLPKIISNEIKSFLELIQNEESPYLKYNIPTKAIINSKKRMLTLLSNSKLYSENLEGRELSQKLLKLIVSLEEKLVIITNNELLPIKELILPKKKIKKELVKTEQEPKKITENIEKINDESEIKKKKPKKPKKSKNPLAFELVKKRSLKSVLDIRAKSNAAAKKSLSNNQTNDED